MMTDVSSLNAYATALRGTGGHDWSIAPRRINALLSAVSEACQRASRRLCERRVHGLPDLTSENVAGYMAELQQRLLPDVIVAVCDPRTGEHVLDMMVATVRVPAIESGIWPYRGDEPRTHVPASDPVHERYRLERK